MLNSIFYEGTFDLKSVIMALLVSLVLGLIISELYRITDDAPGRFAIVLAVMPLLIASIIMIVNGNIGTSVAVLGAFGLVRFRSATGTAWEIVFLFFSMAVGLASGMGYLSLAIIIAVATSLILLILSKTGYGHTEIKQRELKITIPEDLSYNGIFDDVFEKYTSYNEFHHIKTTNMGTMYELCYKIALKDQSLEKDMIDDIRCRNGNLTVSLGLIEKRNNLL